MTAHVRGMTWQQYHETVCAHLGPSTCPHTKRRCRICQELQGSFSKVFKMVARVVYNLPGFEWVMDTIVWSHEMMFGEQYTICLRDKCTGAYG